MDENRRLEKVPHISYDLDGDGYVGGRDYVIAKTFDKGSKGRLTESERKTAFEAVNNVNTTVTYRELNKITYGT